jgi:hypothetical protein
MPSQWMRIVCCVAQGRWKLAISRELILFYPFHTSISKTLDTIIDILSTSTNYNPLLSKRILSPHYNHKIPCHGTTPRTTHTISLPRRSRQHSTLHPPDSPPKFRTIRNLTTSRIAVVCLWTNNLCNVLRSKRRGVQGKVSSKML